MIRHAQFLAAVDGVRAALIVTDALEPVALFAYGIIDGTFQSALHERPHVRDKRAWIPPVRIVEVTDGCQHADVPCTEDPYLANQFFLCLVMPIKQRMRKKESDAHCGTLHLHPNPSIYFPFSAGAPPTATVF